MGRGRVEEGIFEEGYRKGGEAGEWDGDDGF